MCNVLEKSWNSVAYVFSMTLSWFVLSLDSAHHHEACLAFRQEEEQWDKLHGWAMPSLWNDWKTTSQINGVINEGCMHTSGEKIQMGLGNEKKMNPPLTSLLDPGVPQRSCLLGNYMVVKKEWSFITLALTSCCTPVGAILRPLTSWIDPPYILT